MKITEIQIEGTTFFTFRQDVIGSVEMRRCSDRIDCLGIRFQHGAFLELSSSVDISEQLRKPRIFVVEGKPADLFVLFGGEKVYWISLGREILKTFDTFRAYNTAEYWTTKIIERPLDTIFIYEAGVLIIDENLNVKCHKSKLFNDVFTSIEGDSIKLLRDNETEWYMKISTEECRGNENI